MTTKLPIVVKPEDLPIFCPPAATSIVNAHPRIFLNVGRGAVTCPYCGTTYIVEQTSAVPPQ